MRSQDYSKHSKFQGTSFSELSNQRLVIAYQLYHLIQGGARVIQQFEVTYEIGEK